MEGFLTEVLGGLEEHTGTRMMLNLESEDIGFQPLLDHSHSILKFLN